MAHKVVHLSRKDVASLKYIILYDAMPTLWSVIKKARLENLNGLFTEVGIHSNRSTRLINRLLRQSF